MSLSALVEAVAVHAKELDGRGVVDAESPLGFRNLTGDDLACRARLMTAIEELRRLALGPAELLHEMIHTATADVTCLEALARYDIPSRVPADSTATIATLASQIPQLDEETLARFLRNCITIGVFAEPSAGVIQHTPLSRLLLDKDFLHFIRFFAEEDGAASRRQLDALEKWPGSREPQHTGFHLANGEDGGGADAPLFFPVLARDARRVEQAAGAFAAMARMPCRADWAGLRTSPLWQELDRPGDVVVDVGGGRGLACMQIADATTHLRFVVQDLPETAALGRAVVPQRYRPRFEFVAHDFFAAQPKVPGARVYFLRKILHDWPDHYCVRILKNLVPALSEGDRVVVCDFLMPERAEARYEQRSARFSDIIMLQNHNARERTEREFRELFAEVDPRFVVEFEHWDNLDGDGLVKATWKP